MDHIVNTPKSPLKLKSSTFSESLIHLNPSRWSGAKREERRGAAQVRCFLVHSLYKRFYITYKPFLECGIKKDRTFWLDCCQSTYLYIFCVSVFVCVHVCIKFWVLVVWARSRDPARREKFREKEKAAYCFWLSNWQQTKQSHHYTTCAFEF